MKRILSILIAMLLCAALVSGALADELVKVSEPGDADWIDGSNLLRISGENGYHIAEMDGSAITGDDYYRSISYDKGLLVAPKISDEEVNVFGALDLTGAEVVAFKYGDIKVLNEYWALGIALSEATADNYDYTAFIGDGYYLIDTVDVYNVASATCVASLSRAEYASSDAHGAYINIESRSDGVVTTYDAEFNALGTVKYTWDKDLIPDEGIQTFRDNGQYGLQDAQGNVIMEPSFYTIYDFENGYAEVYTGELYGLIDETGAVIVPAEYEDINRGYNTPTGVSRYNNAGYFCVEKDGKLGYVTAGGAVSCEPKYAADALDNNGASATYTDMEGKIHILAADGVESVVEGYEYMYPANYASGVFYRVRNADGGYGLIDFHGNEVLPCEYKDVAMSGDGRYVLVEVDYDNTVIFELSYPEPAAAEAAAPAEGEGEAAADEGEVAAEGEGGNAGLAALLDSAILLVNQDASANQNATVNLLYTAVDQAGAESAAGAIINSAINLLQSDPVANAEAVVGLLENAKTLQ